MHPAYAASQGINIGIYIPIYSSLLNFECMCVPLPPTHKILLILSINTILKTKNIQYV